MASDEDDDHICVKCRKTIYGLDNYISHRKTKCCTINIKNNIINSNINIEVDKQIDNDGQQIEQPVLSVAQAHDFFSSLHLQSSSNKQSSSAADDKLKSMFKMVTRSKAGIIKKKRLSEDMVQSYKEDKKSKKVIESSNITNIINDDDDDWYSLNEHVSHSGGKWKPGETPLWAIKQTRPYGDTEEFIDEESNTSDDDEQEPSDSDENSIENDVEDNSNNDTESDAEPQTSQQPHTGGKWAPTSFSTLPPNHTKGKWGLSWMSMNDKYWCEPCGRRLSSSIVYERHLKSQLHLKKTGERNFRNVSNRPQRIRKPTLAMSNTTIRALKNSFTIKKTKKSCNKFKANEKVICEICNGTYPAGDIGKHLFTPFHHKHILNNEKKNIDMIFKNIHNVLKECLFQCAMCKFYCNDEVNFIWHWSSKLHEIYDRHIKGEYNCSICKVNLLTSDEMKFHLMNESHKEIVQLVKCSIPIIIKKILPIKCEKCNMKFIYNVQLKLHAKQYNHVQETGTGSLSYQETRKCSRCPFFAKSLFSYQKHALRCQNADEQIKGIYFCRPCKLSFDSSAEAKQHRNTSNHKKIVQLPSGLKKDTKCTYCDYQYRKEVEKEAHFKDKHPESLYKCFKCGEGFLKQWYLELHGKHCTLTTNKSEIEKSSIKSNKDDNLHVCDLCNFSSKHKFMLLAHKSIIHNETSKKLQETMNVYSCDDCGKVMPRETLLKHVLVHTKEKLYKCSHCNIRFSRRESLKRHIEAKHIDKKIRSKKQYICSECGQSSVSRNALKTHIQRHRLKKFACTEMGCRYKGRSRAELCDHVKIHSEKREFKCKDCSYTGKTNSQLLKHKKWKHSCYKMLRCHLCPFAAKVSAHLKRHLLTHTESRPYKCPFCAYTCKLLDNLRKHILNTTFHKGLFLYNCGGDCKFGSHISKEMINHLTEQHGDSLKSATIFVQEQVRNPDDVTTEVPKPKKKGRKTLLEKLELQTNDNPTLASVAMTPNKINVQDDIIYNDDYVEHFETLDDPTRRLFDRKNFILAGTSETFYESPILYEHESVLIVENMVELDSNQHINIENLTVNSPR